MLTLHKSYSILLKINAILFSKKKIVIGPLCIFDQINIFDIFRVFELSEIKDHVTIIAVFPGDWQMDTVIQHQKASLHASR